MTTEAILATALKDAETKRKQNLLNSSQLDVLAGPYGVLPAVIELLIEKLGNEKSAMALHVVANCDENVFQNLLRDPLITEVIGEINKLRDIVKNNSVLIEKEYDVTNEGHDYLPYNATGRQIAVVSATKPMAENLVGKLGLYNTHVAEEVTSFGANYLNSVAKQLLPESNNATLPTALPTKSNTASNNQREWVEAAAQAAEAVLVVDFGDQANTVSSDNSHQGYASREYQIQMDYILALHLQMQEIMLFALESAIRQTQAIYMMSMMVATAQHFTTYMIQSCQYQDMMNTRAAHLLDQTGAGVFTSTQNNRHSAIHTSGNQANVFDHTFPALPPRFTAN